jgi:hypothetical protein
MSPAAPQKHTACQKLAQMEVLRACADFETPLE